MKNIILIIFLFFINNCGYTSVYKNLDNKNLNIIIAEMAGDREINNLIKNELKLYANEKSKNKFDISINTKYEKIILTKNTSGIITDYKLSVISDFTIISDEKSENITLAETINIKNLTDIIEQNLYEQNVKRNFASLLREKLISEILTLE